MGKKVATKVVSRWEPLPENASTMQVMAIPEVDEHPLQFEEMTKEDLVNFSKYIEQSNKTLETENMIIERYLSRMDPNALAKMNQILEAAAIALQKAERAAQLGGGTSTLSISKDTSGSKATLESSSDSQRTGTTKSGSVKMGFFGLSDKRQRVQAAQKIEIVNREIDELKNILESFRKKAKRFNYILKCRNEEMSARLAEIEEAQFTFDQKLLVEDLDPMTGRLPGEKFLRYLEKRLKKEEMEINKLRIKTGALKNQLKRVKEQLAQKEELGEVLHAVDFEQLRIENQECQEQLDEKIFYVIQLKRTNGRFGNILNVNKKRLNEQMTSLAQLQQTAVFKEKMIGKLMEDEEKVNSEANAAVRSLEKIKQLMRSYTVPDVMEYVQKKIELHDLKKDIKVKKRQIKLKEMVITRQNKQLRAKTQEFSKVASLGSFSSDALRESRVFFNFSEV